MLFENKPRSGLPTWLAVPLEVASAVRTLTVHRAFVQEFESWAGVPILMFGAAVPAMAAWGILVWAFPGALAPYIPRMFSGDSMLTHRCQRSLGMQPCPPNFAYKHLHFASPAGVEECRNITVAITRAELDSGSLPGLGLWRRLSPEEGVAAFEVAVQALQKEDEAVVARLSCPFRLIVVDTLPEAEQIRENLGQGSFLARTSAQSGTPCPHRAEAGHPAQGCVS